ncbi:YtxH domain-containing protein [Hymenobacter sp. BT730]|uniref:YtxH domain-containing protein n=1 Tax=Hymenobacter sp. BT730 TaxID=3063332 RepID=UPI0026DF1BAC|nr:YtxH domain-containing protein [Hymenobacter sp. BT730]
MKNDSGKVILSLLAGATAGIVTGLLLAPETGEETRTALRKSAGRFSEDLSKLLQEGISRLNDLKTGGVTGEHNQARSAADDLLQSMASGTETGNATNKPAADSDTDEMSGDTRLGG